MCTAGSSFYRETEGRRPDRIGSRSAAMAPSAPRDLVLR
jgi:hypothetical protein